MTANPSSSGRTVLNRFGYRELAKKPTREELAEYYSKKYYSELTHNNYAASYSADELQYFRNKISEKRCLIEPHLSPTHRQRAFLDVGAGEGFALQFFNDAGWQTLGIDYAETGCRNHHPELLRNMRIGDIDLLLVEIAGQNQRFDLIWLDNVLEHVLDPHELLRKLHVLAGDGGLIMVEVPNDYSLLQRRLAEQGAIPDDAWVSYPDHISYFTRDGLRALAEDSGWIEVAAMTDTTIDFNLFNPDTNYVLDRAKGKTCHQARLQLENLIHSVSIEQSVRYYQAVMELGLGRQIISIFQKRLTGTDAG